MTKDEYLRGHLTIQSALFGDNRRLVDVKVNARGTTLIALNDMFHREGLMPLASTYGYTSEGYHLSYRCWCRSARVVQPGDDPQVVWTDMVDGELKLREG